MKLAVVLLALLVVSAPAVLAAARSYQYLYGTRPEEPIGVQPKAPSRFQGLQGIVGRSVPEQEKAYGPQKPFGKPRPKRLKGAANLPGGYVGLGGVAGEDIRPFKQPCEEFGCKPTENVVGDVSTKAYYRCYCAGAKTIAPNNLKCIDTPAIAERIGYHKAGAC